MRLFVRYDVILSRNLTGSRNNEFVRRCFLSGTIRLSYRQIWRHIKRRHGASKGKCYVVDSIGLKKIIKIHNRCARHIHETIIKKTSHGDLHVFTIVVFGHVTVTQHQVLRFKKYQEFLEFLPMEFCIYTWACIAGIPSVVQLCMAPFWRSWQHRCCQNIYCLSFKYRCVEVSNWLNDIHRYKYIDTLQVSNILLRNDVHKTIATVNSRPASKQMRLLCLLVEELTPLERLVHSVPGTRVRWQSRRYMSLWLRRTAGWIYRLLSHCCVKVKKRNTYLELHKDVPFYVFFKKI